MKSLYKLAIGVFTSSLLVTVGCEESPPPLSDEDIAEIERQKYGPTDGMGEMGQDGFLIDDDSAPNTESNTEAPPERSDDL